MAVAAVWLVGAGLVQLVPDETPPLPQSVYGAQPAGGGQRTGRRCRGTFDQRYECTTQAYLQAQQQSFYTWTSRIAIICLPPLALFLAFSLAVQRAQTRDRLHRG